MIRLAKRRAEAGGETPGDDGIEIWDDIMSVMGGAGRMCRAVADWRLPALPSWPSWPNRRGRRGGEAAGQSKPPGTAANAGEHRISEGDLGDRLERLRGGRPERAGHVLAGVVANMLKAKGERPELVDAGDSRKDGLSDAAYILAGKEDSPTAVMCVSRPAGVRVEADEVARFRRECEESGIKRAIVVTDSAFSAGCRRETDGVKMELWDWRKLERNLRTHLLGEPERRDEGLPD